MFATSYLGVFPLSVNIFMYLSLVFFAIDRLESQETTIKQLIGPMLVGWQCSRQDEPWAEYFFEHRADGSTQKVPLENKCLKCTKKRKLHPAMSWEGFSEAMEQGNLDDENALADRLEAGEQPKPWKEDEVVREEGYDVDITRHFQALNYRELVNSIPMVDGKPKPSRIPQRLLASLPSIQAPSEDKTKAGEMEDVYLLHDPARPYRSVSISHRYRIKKTTLKLSRHRHLRKSQGSELKARMVKKQQAHGTREGEALSKLRGQNLLSLGGFHARLVGEGTAGGEDGDGDAGGQHPDASPAVSPRQAPAPVPRRVPPSRASSSQRLDNPSPSPSGAAKQTAQSVRAASAKESSVGDGGGDSESCPTEADGLVEQDENSEKTGDPLENHVGRPLAKR